MPRAPTRATYLGYPNAYGPRQLGPLEWSSSGGPSTAGGTRDPDGGLRMDSRATPATPPTPVLLAVDQPDAPRGSDTPRGDHSVFTVRQRIEFVAERLGHRSSRRHAVGPGRPCHPFCRNSASTCSTEHPLIRAELGYQDPYGPDEAMSRTVDWLLAHRPEPGGEPGARLGDPFDYAAEDALIARWRQTRATLDDLESPLVDPGHFYRHPKKPEESWRPR